MAAPTPDGPEWVAPVPGGRRGGLPCWRVLLSAMLAIGLASGAYMLRHEPLPPDADGGPRCSRLFDARLHAARGGSDADLMALSDAALDGRLRSQGLRGRRSGGRRSQRSGGVAPGAFL